MLRLLKILFIAYLVFVALLVLVVSPTISYFLGPIYQQQTGRTLHYNGAGINPFTLTLYIYKARDDNPSGSTLWSFDELAINLSLASLFAKGVVLDEFSVKSLYVHPQKNKDGTWVFDDILKFRQQLDASTPPAPDTKPDAASALPAITIHKINFNADFLGYADFSRPQPFEFALKKIAISLKDFSTVVQEGHPYHLFARDESGGELEWQGTLSVPAHYSEGTLQLRKISLLPAWRFMQSDVNFKMNSAFLDMGGHYTLSWKNPQEPQYRITQARVAFSKVDISPKTDQQSGILLKELAINQIAVDSLSKTVTAASMDINEFRGTVSVLEDGSTSFQQMLASKPAPETEKPSVKPEAVQKMNGKINEKNNGKMNEKSWQVKLDVIHMNNAAFVFNDYSIQPNFSAHIQDFGGDITPVSTQVNTVTRVDLRGNVDGYAPVTLAGTIKPMADPVALALAFNFKGIELSSFAPYSGTYAGYKINKGLLTVGLNYSLENNKLKGNNKIVINQLTLGEKVRSTRLIDLPLRLALALLTDEHGVIDLDIDVSGDRNHPDFSIGKIVMQALRNVIVKAVTAPFRFLAHLVGGGDDFEFLMFDAGHSQLSDEHKKALLKLKEALAKRPQLNLGIAALSSEEDRHYLKSQSLNQKLIADGIKPEDIEKQSSRFVKAVNRAYQKLQQANYPGAVDNQTTTQQYFLLSEAEANPELPLQQLMNDRAMAVKLFLLSDSGLDASRIYIDKTDYPEHKSAVKLVANVHD